MDIFFAVNKYFNNNKVGKDPVSDFFLNTSSREKKRVYKRALKGAEEEQLKILELARKKSIV